MKRAFEMGPIRPPSEGQDSSLLVRVNRNCPWNRCLFCATYKGAAFSYRPIEEVKDDIAVVKQIADELAGASWRQGQAGRITNEVVLSLARSRPDLYGNQAGGETASPLHCLINVANWLVSGAGTVFLQDANAIIMRTPELVDVIRTLKQTFPSIVRVTSYGRAKTAARKSAAEMKELADAGLTRVHMGLETGCDEVLDYMQKGATSQEQIEGGRKVIDAGISLSEYFMPGLGGRKWSEKHAVESAAVLNAVDPSFIRLRSLIVRRNTPLYEKTAVGDFQPLSEDEVIDEIGRFIEALTVHSYLASDQMSNLLGELEGQLPQDKPRLLRIVGGYRSMSPFPRLAFRLDRRLNSFLAVYGRLPEQAERLVGEARDAIARESPEAAARTDLAVSALKQGFI